MPEYHPQGRHNLVNYPVIFLTLHFSFLHIIFITDSFFFQIYKKKCKSVIHWSIWDLATVVSLGSKKLIKIIYRSCQWKAYSFTGSQGKHSRDPCIGNCAMVTFVVGSVKCKIKGMPLDFHCPHFCPSCQGKIHLAPSGPKIGPVSRDSVLY